MEILQDEIEMAQDEIGFLQDEIGILKDEIGMPRDEIGMLQDEICGRISAREIVFDIPNMADFMPPAGFAPE